MTITSACGCWKGSLVHPIAKQVALQVVATIIAFYILKALPASLTGGATGV